MAGFVYIMSNPLFSRIKIGKSTKDPSKDRLSELNQGTGTPEKFKCEYYAFVGDENALEREVHQKFKNRRPNPNREFFDVSVLEAIEVIRTLSENHGGLKHEDVGCREFKKIKYKDGSCYKGETLNDERHGQGTLVHKIYYDRSDHMFLSPSFFVSDNGWKDFPKDFSLENEKRFFEIEYKYIGEWKNDLQHGQGTKMVRGKMLYEGEWKNGKRDGFGSTSQGEGYIGHFKNDMFHGDGKMKKTFSFGAIKIYSQYTGQYEFDKKHGEGEYSFDNKDIKEYYKGSWKSDEKHGEGEYSSDNKDIKEYYKGSWKSDKKHGRGFERLTIADGDIVEFTGEFREGYKKKGTNSIKNPDGKTTELTADKWDYKSPVDFATEIIKYPDGATSQYKGGWHYFYCGTNEHGGKVGEGSEIYSFNDGTVRDRTGDWDGGMGQGTEIVTKINGEKIVRTGTWFRGNLHGHGTEIIMNGDAIISEYTGGWVFGKKIFEEAQNGDAKERNQKINNWENAETFPKPNQPLNWLLFCAGGGVLISWWLDIL